MKQKTFGIFLIVFGGYLVIGNTLFSMLFNYAGSIGFYVPMSLEEYWQGWWMQYGVITILVAAAGILSVCLGIHILRKNKKTTNNNILIPPQPQTYH